MQALFLQAPAGENRALFKYGFLDKNGKMAFWLDLKGVAHLGNFSEGLCQFRETGEQGAGFGFIDKSGRKVIPAKFAAVHDFHEGRALVRIADTEKPKNGKWGYIDRTGNMIISPRFAFACDFCEGLALVQEIEHGKCGYIDNTGRMLIPAQFSFGGDFHEGLAATERGYIDKTGNLKILSNRGGQSNFSCGLAAREVQSIAHEYYGCTKDGSIYADNRQWGYLDRTGRFAILPRFLKSWEFSENRALVEMPLSLPPERSVTGNHGAYGFIDEKGRVVTMLKTQLEPHKYSCGLAAVHLNSENGQGWGFIDLNGRIAIEPEFKIVDDFYEDLAAVDGGYINRAGRLVIPIETLSHARFSEGLAAVVLPR